MAQRKTRVPYCVIYTYKCIYIYNHGRRVGIIVFKFFHHKEEFDLFIKVLQCFISNFFIICDLVVSQGTEFKHLIKVVKMVSVNLKHYSIWYSG